MENPAFTLPPEMILRLLRKLSGSNTPHIKQFYDLLASIQSLGPAGLVLLHLIPVTYLLVCLVPSLTQYLAQYLALNWSLVTKDAVAMG